MYGGVTNTQGVLLCIGVFYKTLKKCSKWLESRGVILTP